MVWSEQFFADGKRVLDQRFGFSLAPLRLVDLTQIVQERGDRGIFPASRLLVDRKRPLEEGLGIGVAVLPLIERREIVQGLPDIGIAGPSDFSRSASARLNSGSASA